MRRFFLSTITALTLIVSAIPVSVASADPVGSVEDYTTTSYAPWWNMYHLTSKAGADAEVKGGEGGQMVFSMAVSADGQKLYYGTDTGGIWLSDDGGANWRLSQTGFVVHGADDIAIDPDNADIAFAAGMLASGNTTNGNTGIYRTTDGGATWSLVKNTGYYYKFTNKVIKFGAKHADDHRTIYAGTHSEGIFKSDDGGDSWTNIGRTGDQIEDLYVDPSDADSPLIVEASEQSGVVVSTDDGASWNQMNNGLPLNIYGVVDVYSLAVSPADPSTWLVTINGDKKLYRTTDAGANWSAAGEMTSSVGNGQPLKLNFGAWDGSNTPVLYISLAGSVDAVRYSTDLGETLQTPVYDQSLALRDQTGFWPEALTVDPTHPWTVWAAIDGVIYKSTNEGSVQFSPSGSGSSGMRVYDMVFDDAGDIQYIGVMDHGIYKAEPGYDTDYPPVKHLDGVQRWGGVWSALGLAMDPNDPQHIFAKVGDWGSNLIIEESTDGGETWTQLENTNSSHGVLEYNKNDDQVIYAASYRSDDNGATWTKLDYPIGAVSPVDNDVVYATKNSKIYKSADRGDTWKALDATIADIQQITADGLKSDRVWAGTFNNGMYRVDGDTATHIDSTMLQGSVNDGHGIFKVVQDPSNPFHYFAGGADNNAQGPGAGLFESLDGGNTWELVPDMPGMKDIWTLVVNPVKPLVYVSTSNGIMVYDWSKRSLTFPDITPVKVGQYSEDFGDGLAQGWTLDGYQVHASGVLYTGSRETLTATYDWQEADVPYDYKVDAVTYDTEETNRMRFIFNYKDASNYNYFDFGSSGTPTINLVKVVDGIESTIATDTPNYVFAGSWATIEIRSSGEGKVSVNAIRGDNTVHLFTDVEDETFATGGKVGVGSQNWASGAFDNIGLADASAAEAEAPTHGITEYTEDFNDGQAQDWTLSEGFQFDSGVMFNNEGDQIALYDTGIATTPFEFKVDLATWNQSNGNKMRVYLNYQSDSNYEYLELGGGNPADIKLIKRFNNTESTIATYPGNYNFYAGNGMVTIDIKSGNDGLFNIDAIRGGVTTHLFSNVIDPTFSSGKIGVGTQAGFIVVDNIQVKSLAPTGPISLYTENFHDGAAQGWRLGDNFAFAPVNGNQVMYTTNWGGNEIAVFDRQIAYAPYEYRTNFYFGSTGDGNRMIAIFNYQDEDNYDFLSYGGSQSTTIKLEKIVDGAAPVTIATSTTNYTFADYETALDIQVDADGKISADAIRGGVTTNLFTDVVDAGVTSGKIGMGVRSAGTLYWTDVRVIGTAPIAPETIAAINAIDALPEADHVQLTDKAQVDAARELVNAALLNDAGAVITNIDKLEACEAGIQGFMTVDVIEAIDALPELVDLTLDDEQAVVAARTLVDNLLAYGPHADITNLDKLVASEARIDYLHNIIGIVTDSEIVMTAGHAGQIDVVTDPAGASLKFESLDPDIVQVDKYGAVTANKAGSTFIIVRAIKEGWVDNSFVVWVYVDADADDSYLVSDGTITTTGGGITASAKITHQLISDGKQGVAVFQLMKTNAGGDIPVAALKKPVGDAFEETIGATFASYTGSDYYVKVMVWDKLDNDPNSIGTDLAEPVRINP